MDIIMADLDRANEVNILLFAYLLCSEQQSVLFEIMMSLVKLLQSRR